MNVNVNVNPESIKGKFTPSIGINSVMPLAIPFSLKTMESLRNRVSTYFQATPLISMKTKSQVSSQSSHSVDGDGDTWCERALTVNFNIELIGKISFKNIKFD